MHARLSALGGISYGWWMVGGLSLTEFVSWGVLIYAFPVLAVPMSEDLGWSYASLNTGYAIGIAVSALAGIPVGRWLQRGGSRRVMTAGTLLATTGLLAWSRVGAVGEFLAVSVVLGLAMSMNLYEPALATTAVWFSRRRAQAVLVITTVAGTASAAFGPLTAALVDRADWRSALVSLAAVTLVVGLPVHALLLRGSAARPPVPRPAAGPSAPSRPSFSWLVAGLSLSTFTKSAVVAGLPGYLVGRGYSLTHAATAAGALGLAQVAGRIALIGLRGRWAEQHLAAVLFVAQTVSSGPLLLISGDGPVATATVVGFVLVFGIGCGLVEVLRGTLIPEFYGVADYARVNGIVSVYVVGGRALGPVVVGVGLALGHPTLVLGAVAGVATVSAIALLAADRAYRREEARLTI